MMKAETIEKCKELIYRYYRNQCEMDTDKAKEQFKMEGNYLNLIDAKYGPYNICVDIDLAEGFLRYSAILSGDENSRMLIDTYYENDEEMMVDLHTLDFSTWYNSAILHLREVVSK